VISKTQARALIGGFIIAGSAMIVLSGTFLLIAYGLSRSKTARAAGKVITTVVPGGKVITAAGAVKEATKTKTTVTKGPKTTTRIPAEKKEKKESKPERLEPSPNGKAH
jgi:preprotein translocase subunit YajC